MPRGRVRAVRVVEGRLSGSPKSFHILWECGFFWRVWLKTRLSGRIYNCFVNLYGWVTTRDPA